RDLSDDRHLAFDTHAHPVALKVERRRMTAPDVSRRAFRARAMERNSARMDRSEDLALDPIGGLDHGAADQHHVARCRDSAKEVHADEIGDVSRPWPLRDFGCGPRLNDATAF